MHLRRGAPALALHAYLDDEATPGCRPEALRLAFDSISGSSRRELGASSRPAWEHAWSVPAMAARRELRQAILERLAQLDALERPACVQLLRVAYDGEHEWLLPRLAPLPHLQLAYLRSLMPTRSARAAPAPLPPFAHAATPGRHHRVAVASGDASLAASSLAISSDVAPLEKLPEGMHDTYVQLLCAHAFRGSRPQQRNPDLKASKNFRPASS